MKQVLLFFLLQLFFLNISLTAQIENRSVEGQWRSVKMKLIKDEFRPFYKYYPESDEDALKIKISKDSICFDKKVIGFKSNTLYPIAFSDKQTMMSSGSIIIVKSDAYHIILSVPDLSSVGNKAAPFYIAFERDY